LTHFIPANPHCKPKVISLKMRCLIMKWMSATYFNARN
jgi:hypothetical protein